MFRGFKYRDTYAPSNQQFNWPSVSVPFETVSNMLPRAKPIAVKRIELNFRKVKQGFRRTVSYYRGPEAARHLGFLGKLYSQMLHHKWPGVGMAGSTVLITGNEV